MYDALLLTSCRCTIRRGSHIIMCVENEHNISGYAMQHGDATDFIIITNTSMRQLPKHRNVTLCSY